MVWGALKPAEHSKPKSWGWEIDWNLVLNGQALIVYLLNSCSSKTQSKEWTTELVICESEAFTVESSPELGLTGSLQPAFERSDVHVIHVTNDCCFSVAKSCPALCNPMDCRTPGSSVLHYLLEFAIPHCHLFQMAKCHLCDTYSSFPRSSTYCLFSLPPTTLLMIYTSYSERLFLCLTPLPGNMSHGKRGLCHSSSYSACLTQSLYGRHYQGPTHSSHPSF